MINMNGVIMNELKIVNLEQVSRYLKYGVKPKRIENGYNDRIIFVYDKNDELNHAYSKWLNHDEF